MFLFFLCWCFCWVGAVIIFTLFYSFSLVIVPVIFTWFCYSCRVDGVVFSLMLLLSHWCYLLRWYYSYSHMVVLFFSYCVISHFMLVLLIFSSDDLVFDAWWCFFSCVSVVIFWRCVIALFILVLFFSWGHVAFLAWHCYSFCICVVFLKWSYCLCIVLLFLLC